MSAEVHLKYLILKKELDCFYAVYFLDRERFVARI